MKIKYYIGIGALVFANSAEGTDALTYLQGRGWFETITVTSTNIVFKCNTSHPDSYPLDIVATGEDMGTIYYPKGNTKNNEDLILPLGRTIWVSESPRARDKKGGIRFTPVVFKNQLNGFRITEINNFGREITKIAYLALNDTPVEVDEDDVEKIMLWRRREDGRLYGGEWKAPEEIKIIGQTELTAEPNVTIVIEEECLNSTLDSVPEPEPKSSPAIVNVPAKQPTPEPECGSRDGSPNRPWFCTLPLLILAIGGTLYFRCKK